jgi:hypothetical protein
MHRQSQVLTRPSNAVTAKLVNTMLKCCKIIPFHVMDSRHIPDSSTIGLGLTYTVGRLSVKYGMIQEDNYFFGICVDVRVNG